MIEKESEIGLLDLLLIVAENIKLLLLGPLVIGLLALGLAYLMPPSYTSQAILALPLATAQQAAVMVVSPLVLDPVIQSRQMARGRSVQVARASVAGQIKATVGKDGLLRLDVTDETPSQAQSIANAVIDAWLKTTVPSDQIRADLEKRLIYAKTSSEVVTRVINHLDVSAGNYLAQPLTRGDAGTTLVALGELQTRYLNEMLSIPHEIQGLDHDVVKQPPTLPTDPVSPKKALVAILAALVGGFVLLLWILVRNAWRNAAQDPALAQKQSRLAAAFSLRK